MLRGGCDGGLGFEIWAGETNAAKVKAEFTGFFALFEGENPSVLKTKATQESLEAAATAACASF